MDLQRAALVNAVDAILSGARRQPNREPSHPTSGWPRPEERRADPDDGRALLDRDLEVGAHAHRQPAAEAGSTAAQPLRQLGAARRKSAAPARASRPAGPRSSARAARGVRARPARQRQPRESAGVEAGLGRIGVDVDLQVDGQRYAAAPASAASRSSRRASSTESTDWMASNSATARAALFDWRWPISSHRAAGSAAALAAASCTRFSPKVVSPSSSAGAQPLDGHGLRHGQQLDRRRVAAGARAGARRCAGGHLSAPRRARRRGRLLGRLPARVGRSGCGAGRPGCRGPRPRSAGRATDRSAAPSAGPAAAAAARRPVAAGVRPDRCDRSVSTGIAVACALLGQLAHVVARAGGHGRRAPAGRAARACATSRSRWR